MGYRGILKSNSGFTLFELVIVLAVLGALAAITVSQLTGVKGRMELIGYANTISLELENSLASAIANDNRSTFAVFNSDNQPPCDRLKLGDIVSPKLEEANLGVSIDKPENKRSVSMVVPKYEPDTGEVSTAKCFLYEVEESSGSQIGGGPAPIN